MELQGSLFAWRPQKPVGVAFESGDTECPQKVVFLGGLGSGLFGCPFVLELHRVVQAAGWSLVQPMLSSSLVGYGTGSLRRDTEELDALLTHLVQERNATRFALIGHSTGCQQSVHFCNHGQADLVARVALVVLQAPVSDREAGTLDPATAQWVARAREMAAQGADEELMPRAAHPNAPITAARFRSLFDVDGEDDLFSSDLSDEQLASNLRKVGQGGRHAVVAFSGADQYVPDTVNKHVLLQRLCKAIVADSDTQSAVVSILQNGANHNLSLPADGAASAEFLQVVGGLLQTTAESVLDRSLAADRPKCLLT